MRISDWSSDVCSSDLKSFDDDALIDERIGALLIGPGLGRDDEAARRLDRALATSHRLVLDGDALHLLKDRMAVLKSRAAPVILTPHAGEFAALFGEGEGSKIDRARAAACEAGVVMVFKGADTVIAAPDRSAEHTSELQSLMRPAYAV